MNIRNYINYSNIRTQLPIDMQRLDLVYIGTQREALHIAVNKKLSLLQVIPVMNVRRSQCQRSANLAKALKFLTTIKKAKRWRQYSNRIRQVWNIMLLVMVEFVLVSLSLVLAIFLITNPTPGSNMQVFIVYHQIAKTEQCPLLKPLLYLLMVVVAEVRRPCFELLRRLEWKMRFQKARM